MFIAFIVALPIVIAFSIFMINNWQKAFLAALFFSIIEGAVRKWILPGSQGIIYFVKDGLFLLAYIGYFSRYKPIKNLQAVRILIYGLGACAILAFFQLFNPYNPSIMLYLIGVKSYFIYIPMAFLVPEIFKTRKSVNDFIRVFLIFSIPISILGFVQFYVGPYHWLSVYVTHTSEAAHISRFGNDLGRTSGTFSYIGGFTNYLLLIATLCFAILSSRRLQISGNGMVYLVLILSIGAMFTTGSRGPIVILVILTMLSTIFMFSRGMISLEHFSRLVLILPIVVFLSLQIAPEAVTGLANRAANSDSNVMRILGPFVQPFTVINDIPSIGFGLGTTHNSSLTIMQSNYHWWLNGVRAESETARVIIEIGLLGFLFYYGFLVLTVFISTVPLLKTSNKPMGIFSAVMMFFLLMMLLSPFVNNPSANISFWFLIGILHAYQRIYSIEKYKYRNMKNTHNVNRTPSQNIYQKLQ